jgi:hypothetical protein
MPLRIRRARNLRSGALVGIHCQAAAIESLQIGPTKVIRSADELCSGARDQHPTIAGRLFGLARNGATSNEQQHHHNNKRIAQTLHLETTRVAERERLLSRLRGCRSSPDWR